MPKYIQVGFIIILFEFVIYVMQRHLLCRSALWQVGAVGFGGRDVSAIGDVRIYELEIQA